MQSMLYPQFKLQIQEWLFKEHKFSLKENFNKNYYENKIAVIDY